MGAQWECPAAGCLAHALRAVAVPRSRPFLRHSPEEVPGKDRAERRQGGAPCRAGTQAVGRTPSPAPLNGLGVTWQSPLSTQRLRSGVVVVVGEDICPCGTCWQRQRQSRMFHDPPFPSVSHPCGCILSLSSRSQGLTGNPRRTKKCDESVTSRAFLISEKGVRVTKGHRSPVCEPRSRPLV